MLYMQIYAHRAAGVYLHIQCSEIILREVKAMEFLSYLISGISLGSVYAIIALGYTMVYGIAKDAELCTRRYYHDRRLRLIRGCQ